MILTHGINSLKFDKTNTVIIGGRVYPFVTIGTQIWLAENLDWKYRNDLSINPTGNPSTPAAWYVYRDESTYGYNGAKCGLLYNQYAVDELNSLLPTGWRVPSQSDFSTLITFTGGGDTTKRALCGSWNSSWDVYCYGGDPYGFNWLPAGSYYDSNFGYVGQEAVLWSITQRIRFITGSGTATAINERDRNRGHPIRLIFEAQ